MLGAMLDLATSSNMKTTTQFHAQISPCASCCFNVLGLQYWFLLSVEYFGAELFSNNCYFYGFLRQNILNTQPILNSG